MQWYFDLSKQKSFGFAFGFAKTETKSCRSALNNLPSFAGLQPAQHHVRTRQHRGEPHTLDGLSSFLLILLCDFFFYRNALAAIVGTRQLSTATSCNVLLRYCRASPGAMKARVLCSNFTDHKDIKCTVIIITDKDCTSHARCNMPPAHCLDCIRPLSHWVDEEHQDHSDLCNIRLNALLNSTFPYPLCPRHRSTSTKSLTRLPPRRLSRTRHHRAYTSPIHCSTPLAHRADCIRLLDRLEAAVHRDRNDLKMLSKIRP